MMTRVNEMIDALNAQTDAAAGFSAKTLYKTGQEYGLTCKEVLETFLGKEKAITRGLYAATLDAQVKVFKAAAKKAPKKAAKPIAKKVTADADDSEPCHDNSIGMGYIATPEEIAESYK